MGEVSTIGVDLAKNVFQVHGAAADGSVLFRKKLSRPQFARFMAQQPPCLVAMEACASAHHWAREMARYGHEVRLIAPHYVKPFLKRQKNDAADGRCCRSLTTEDLLRESMRLHGLHEQAIPRPLSHDQLVQLQCVAAEAGVPADLGRQGHDLARAA